MCRLPDRLSLDTQRAQASLLAGKQKHRACLQTRQNCARQGREKQEHQRGHAHRDPTGSTPCSVQLQRRGGARLRKRLQAQAMRRAQAGVGKVAPCRSQQHPRMDSQLRGSVSPCSR